MYKITSAHTISRVKQAEIMEELTHIATNINIDYPNFDVYYYDRQQNQMVGLFLFEPELVRLEDIKNYTLVKL